jgi:hypothetical protein
MTIRLAWNDTAQNKHYRAIPQPMIEKALEHQGSQICLNVKGGVRQAWSLKAASKFEEQGDSFDQMGPVIRGKSARHQSPMNL